jgi:hypothetical protein
MFVLEQKNLRHHFHGLFQPLSIPTLPSFSISMYFIKNLSPSNSCNSILVVVECLMKMVYFIPCIQTIIIEGTTKLFLNHVFQYDEHHKEQPRFKVNNQIWIQQQNVKTTWPLDRLDYL